MASAFRSFEPDPRFDRGVRRAPLETSPRRERSADVTVIVRPESESGRYLQHLKNISSAICGALVLAVGVAYGERVYVEMRSESARDRLAALQRHEHQLSVSIEALKFQAAELAEASDTGLIPQTPDRFLFVEPALSRPDRQRQAAVPANDPPQFPIGY